MTDQEKPAKKKQLTLSTKLDLKNLTAAGGNQSASARGKTVIVEVKKGPKVSKTVSDAARGGPRLRSMQADAEKKQPAAQPVETKKPVLKKKEADLSHLTDSERSVRINALKDAMAQAHTEREKEALRMQREQEAARNLQQKKATAAEAEALATAAAAEKAAAEIPESPKPESTAEAPQAVGDTTEDRTEKTAGKNRAVREAQHADAERKQPNRQKKSETPHRVISHRDAPRRTGKMTVSQALGGGDKTRTRSMASIRRAREKERKKLYEAEGPAVKIVRNVVIPEAITVQDLSNRMAERSADVIKMLMKMDMMLTITQSIDGDTAQLIAEEFGHTVQRVSEEDLEREFLEEMLEGEEEVSELPRPPVVTVMGHVDHGKTSLLDALRKTDVVAGESGGITQHIGAYQVTLASDKKITFIDTPGHAAFTKMRARGANVTDIVILLVAADDGVKDQTIEAINHAKAAGVPIIVAINKIDKPEANAERVKTELLQHEIVLEDFGGDILSVEVSAKQRTNLDKLEEIVLLQSEILDLKAPVARSAVATVVEARLEKGRGAVATVLVQKGTLRVGDIFVAGSQCGRVRAMTNDHGKRVMDAIPSTPIEITGFDGAPQAGDTLIVVQEESRAREIATFRDHQRRSKEAARYEKRKKDNLFSNIGKPEVSELNVIIKSDAQGSSEAIAASLEKLATEEININIIHMGVGAISETDVVLASAADALIVGFHVRANTLARELSEKEKVEIRYFSIIYDVIDDVKATASGMLSPILQEKFIGKAEIRQIFKISSMGTIAGCYVTDGMVRRGSKVRLLRDDVVIHEGSLKTLKRFKDEVKEVKESYECGMAFESYNDLKVGDIIECAEIEEIARTL